MKQSTERGRCDICGEKYSFEYMKISFLERIVCESCEQDLRDEFNDEDSSLSLDDLVEKYEEYNQSL